MKCDNLFYFRVKIPILERTLEQLLITLSGEFQERAFLEVLVHCISRKPLTENSGVGLLTYYQRLNLRNSVSLLKNCTYEDFSVFLHVAP